MIAIVKSTIKLLLRNKGFLFFLLVTPVVSTLFLGMKMDHMISMETSDKNVIYELDSYTDRALYVGDTATCIIKVYDDSNSELSEYVLKELAKIGMFSVCRGDVSGLTEEEVDANAERDAFDDRAGMLIYLKEDFDEAVLSENWEQGLKLYVVSEDERQEIFKAELTGLIGRIKQVQATAGDDVAAIMKVLEEMQEQLPDKEVINFTGKEKVALTEKQIGQKNQIGYAIAIITLGFVFCGVCLAHSVIEEQNNKVYTRVLLSKVSGGEYFGAKFAVVFVISLMQTIVLGICTALVPGLDVGMDIMSFMLLIFMLGLIFSTLSLLLGVIIGNVMSSNYAMFAIWSISALLAGLYFPLDNTTKALKTISYLMPQRWFMDAAEKILVGDKSAYSMVLCVTVAYLAVLMCVGGVRLKLKRQE